MNLEHGTRSGGFERYLATNSTAAAQSTTLGTVGSKILTAAQLATFTVFPLGRTLTLEMIFMGVGSAGNTADYNIWGVSRLASVPAGSSTYRIDSTGVLVTFLGGASAGGGTYTLGTGAGVTGGVATAANDGTTQMKFAKTLTWTASGIATTIPGPLVVAESSLVEGTSVAYSSASAADIAMLFMPCLARFTGIIVDFKINTSVTEMNCLIRSCDL